MRHAALFIWLLCTAWVAGILWADWPGVVTPDTKRQLLQGMAGEYDNWKPAIYSWMLGGLEGIGKGYGTSLMFALQIILMGIAVGGIAVALLCRAFTGYREENGEPPCAAPPCPSGGDVRFPVFYRSFHALYFLFCAARAFRYGTTLLYCPGILDLHGWSFILAYMVGSTEKVVSRGHSCCQMPLTVHPPALRGGGWLLGRGR